MSTSYTPSVHDAAAGGFLSKENCAQSCVVGQKLAVRAILVAKLAALAEHKSLFTQTGATKERQKTGRIGAEHVSV